MKLQCTSLKDFSSMRLGNIKKGDPVTVDSVIAKQMVEQGYVELTQETTEKLSAMQKAKAALGKNKK